MTLLLIVLTIAFLVTTILFLVFWQKAEKEKNNSEKSLIEYQAKLNALDDSEQRIKNTFEALASNALKSNSSSFLELAKAKLETLQAEAKNDVESRKKAIENLVNPINELIKDVRQEIEKSEKERAKDSSALREHLESVNKAQLTLKDETENLVKALRRPEARGRWGEIQLRRVVEIAGMVNYCDFEEQKSIEQKRPDMIIRLPNKRNVVVDSKVPIQSYLDAIETKDSVQKDQKMKNHATSIRTHINNLAAKSYWEQFQPAPEFVVLFIPGEVFLYAALQEDPNLIEFGASKQVILATPTTLISLLKAVAYGWRQEQIAQNAQMISNLGKELYERIRTFTEHFLDLQKSLDKAVESYNSAVGTFESRILVTARKFKELGTTGSQDINSLQQIEKTTRSVQSSDDITKLKGENSEK